MKKIDLILLAAGSGKRFGHTIPKQFYKVNNIPVFIRTLSTITKLNFIRKIILVINEEFKDKYISDINQFGIEDKRIIFVVGGAHRFDSISNGIEIAETDNVMIMEAARPFADEDLYERVYSNKNKIVISAMKSAQTPYIIENDKLVKVISTDNVALSTTPKKYDRKDLKKRISESSRDVNDEAELFIEGGIHYEWSDSINIKITNPIDKFVAEKIAEDK